MLTLAQDHAAGDPSLESIEGHTVKTHKAIGPIIVTNRATRPELWAGLALLHFGGLDGFKGFGTRTASQLRPKPETTTGFAIDAVMGRVGIGDPFFPTHAGYPRSRCIELLLRCLQNGFMSIYVKLDTHCPYDVFRHKKSIPEFEQRVKGISCLRAAIFSSPCMNAGVSENGGRDESLLCQLVQDAVDSRQPYSGPTPSYYFVYFERRWMVLGCPYHV